MSDFIGYIKSDEKLPWSCEKWIREFLKKDTKLLNMGTVTGFLLNLGHPDNLTAVTKNELVLPFSDESFDLVINRQEVYSLAEVYRVLKKGGYFITEQLGAGDTAIASSPQNPQFNLENERQLFIKSGFKVVKRDQSYRVNYFTDAGVLCQFQEHRFIIAAKK